MGGQACILYGAAEFSKDFDFILLLDQENLESFKRFAAEIRASVIAVPPFEYEYLAKGHAVHFRAAATGLEQLRIDVMCKLRGVEPFPVLWNRRTSAELLPGLTAEILSLHDLVLAKKTQRDKDWPMIRRLVDVDYLRNRESATENQVRFWMRELRSPIFLIECASHWPEIAQEVARTRSDVVHGALSASRSAIEQALEVEQKKIREEDRFYWKPLIDELNLLRRKKVGNGNR